MAQDSARHFDVLLRHRVRRPTPTTCYVIQVFGHDGMSFSYRYYQVHWDKDPWVQQWRKDNPQETWATLPTPVIVARARYLLVTDEISCDCITEATGKAWPENDPRSPWLGVLRILEQTRLIEGEYMPESGD